MNGQISAVFGKLSALHAKNAFAFAIIAGELFQTPDNASDEAETEVDQLLNGKIEVPLPTYFAMARGGMPARVAERLKDNAGELCPNLYFLGRRTTVKTSEGVRIVALGGVHANLPNDKEVLGEFMPVHTDNDVKILRGANNADILVTSEWPAEIRTGSQAAYTGEDPVSQQGVAELCTRLKPRYHFSCSSGFFEREPFFHTQDEDSVGYQITRFISLAPYGNPNKQKWIYAFSLDPSAAPPVTIPSGVTASPLSFVGKKRKAEDAPGFSRYSNGDSQPRRQNNKRRRAPPPTPQECFFCLSNPNIAAHLITSIGNSAYLTTAKGPLSTSTTFPTLGFPGHTLIIPLEHAPSIAAIQDTDSKRDTVAEMQRYRNALQQMVAARGKDAPETGKLGAVTWDITRAGGIHIHWQFLPVPQDLISKGLVEAAFKVEAENERYPKFAEKENVDEEVEGDYFKVTIWSQEEDGKTKEKVLVLPLDPSFRFDLQFARRVLAKLLGLEKRLHWQDCAQTEEEETKDAEAFKEAFKLFDFSLEE